MSVNIRQTDIIVRNKLKPRKYIYDVLKNNKLIRKKSNIEMVLKLRNYDRCSKKTTTTK